jgi:transposase
MVYIKSQKGQSWLLPPNIQDMIPEDHICFLIGESIDHMDFSDFDEKVEGAGHPAYHPRILLKVLMQGMLDKVRSSRKLERACKENVVYLFLSERLNPNFRTISDFRKANPELVDETFKETVRLAQSLNLVSVEMICTDGSKIKANASRKLAIKREGFDLLDEWVKNEIEEGIKQDDIEDKLEEALDLKNKPKLARKDMKKIVREYRERLNDAKKAEDLKKKHQAVRAQLAHDSTLKTISLTDPECRYMQSKKGPTELSYNVQTSVDSKHNIIVANDVCQETNDTRQGRPQLEQAEKNLRQTLPEGLKVAMDADYDDSPTLKWLEDRKFDAYIPLAEKGAKKKEESSQYNKKFFIYLEEADAFKCPEGKILPYKSDYKSKRGQFLKMYYSFKACHRCPAAQQCYGKAENRVITATEYEAVIRRMKAKMELAESRKVYSKRKETSELAYAHIKHNLGFTEFLTRGLKGVKTEWNLACAASNLRRIWNQMLKTGVSLKQVFNQITQSFWQLFTPA